ncbi:MAG: hypothetical protein OXI63_07945 [Candidatus Poribacteria bacterium]|nr:hypothetical protein [Candidatus Poribacteria bacterium]
MKKKLYSVLTGDLVDSSKLTSDESRNAMQWLREAARKFNDLHPQSIEGELDTFRHDTWQLLMGRPFLCLRAAVFMRTALMLHSTTKAKYDSRISIGIGEVEMIAESRVSDSRGPAFLISGKNLDTMGRNRLVCEVQDRDSTALALVGSVVVPLLDCVVTDWTSTEAHAVSGSLEGLTQESIAQLLPPNPRTERAVTRQAVSDSLERGYWRTVESVLNDLETNSKVWNLP